MKNFNLRSKFSPKGDQQQAIEKLVSGLNSGYSDQVLLGVTGSGKTFTMANVIKEVNLPTLVISHNKTLAAQLYQEFRDFFPDNAVSYFVSYYDYYQPEAYISQTDTYIEKEASINEEIDKLRLAATANLLTRPDTIVVSSVSCIYNLGSPDKYGEFMIKLKKGDAISRNDLFLRLTELQYERSEFDFKRGTFRVRGDRIDIYPSYLDVGIRVEIEKDRIKSLKQFDPLTGRIEVEKLSSSVIYPAKHYLVERELMKKSFSKIREDLKTETELLKKKGLIFEAERLKKRVNYDLEMISEFGYVNGIENYSRYFDGRAQGEAPFTLMDYFPQKYLTIIDESHITVPQIRGMHAGDLSRKKSLIDNGFRLKAAYDNRPLKFDEFLTRKGKTIYTSATPSIWEVEKSKNRIVEQLIRPTGLIDPIVKIKPSKRQIEDLLQEIEKRKKKKQRVLVTTLTKRMAEDLTDHLKEKGVDVHYLHSDVKTLDRADTLDDLREGKYDCLVGINLLREGLDLPEVSLAVILDADKEGFLRSRTSLIQTMGRAARNVDGEIIMYADEETQSMKQAIKEVKRRREIQLKYNKKHNITPETISKPLREKLIQREKKLEEEKKLFDEIFDFKPEALLPDQKKKKKVFLTREMKKAAEDLNFELAALIRDKIKEL